MPFLLFLSHEGIVETDNNYVGLKKTCDIHHHFHKLNSNTRVKILMSSLITRIII